MGGVLYAAVWHPASYDTFWTPGMAFDAFLNEAQTRHSAGWRLMRARSVETDGGRQWVGLWRTGLMNSSTFRAGRSESKLVADHAEMQAKGRRMIDVHAYVRDGVTRWSGVFIGGSGTSLFIPGFNWASLKQEAQKRHLEGWRLVRVQPYTEAGARCFAALWKQGSAASFYNDYDAEGLAAAVVTKAAEGKHLVDVEPYWDDTGNLRYVGVWLSGPSTSAMRIVDREGLDAVTRQHHGAGLRMQSIAAVTHPCECMNQAVMPETYTAADGETITTYPYNYGVTATETHCEGAFGTCGPPAPGDAVHYRWPVDEVDGDRYLRVDSIDRPSSFLTLPFTDTAVKRGGIWRYGNGGWHHAGDYWRGAETFSVVASAAGRVVHVGWDWWSGNTVVVSHPVDGVEDAYRTVYMHLRNGPAHDKAAAWEETVPRLGDDDRTAYTDFLEQTGMGQDGDTEPDPAYWGTEEEAIDPALLSSTVERGQHLAWAGCTGPGGQRWSGSPNTHLHIFWARRDPADDRWYLFDPYGIYGMPTCYPANVTDALGPCARWGSAWQGGAPAYPGP